MTPITAPISSLNDLTTRIALLALHSVQIGALQEDRKRQNGTLDRLEAKLDALVMKILVASCAFTLAAVGWVVVLLQQIKR